MITPEITAVIVATCTIVYTVGTLLLWFTTERTVRLMKRQIDDQAAANRSSAWHNLIDAHRELYLEIIGNKDLLEIYSKENNLKPYDVQRKYLATLMVNHALRIFLDYENKLDIPGDLEGYTNDLRSMLQFEFVQERWVEIESFYPQSFREFLQRVRSAQPSRA